MPHASSGRRAGARRRGRHRVRRDEYPLTVNHRGRGRLQRERPSRDVLGEERYEEMDFPDRRAPRTSPASSTPSRGRSSGSAPYSPVSTTRPPRPTTAPARTSTPPCCRMPRRSTPSSLVRKLAALAG